MKLGNMYIKNLRYSPNFLLCLRIIFCLLVSLLFVVTIINDTYQIFLENSLKFLTYWGLWATQFYFLCSVFNGSYYSVNVGTFAIFNHIIVSLNVLISIFWFFVLFNGIVEPDIKLYLGILRHSVPLITTFIEFIFNNNLAFYKNILYILVVTILYIPVNFFYSYYLGTPVYDLIDYTDYQSAIIILFALGLSMGAGAILVIFQSLVKPWIFTPFQKHYDAIVKCDNENDKICDLDNLKADKGNSIRFKNVEKKNDKTFL